jgi:putative multicomponent Na+:H+ antiporter subunit B
MTDPYIYAIVALLPLTALMLVLQSNPYNALILRGILGAIAALIYSILGAADVALTEALMGTLLSISLYAIAVRSSMVVRLGILSSQTTLDSPLEQLCQRHIDDLRTIFSKHYLRLELVTYHDLPTLRQALRDRDIHTTIALNYAQIDNSNLPPVEIATRISSLYDMMRSELPSATNLTYLNPLASTLTVTEPQP